jgi:signal peptidase I
MCTIAMIIWAIFHPAGERVFSVPSVAMAPTLIIGDTVVMVPYVAGGGPARGDIVAFVDPRDARMVQVFRVIGLPGDSVRLVDGVVEINGAPVERQAIGEYLVDFGYELQSAELWRETLPNAAAFETLDTEPEGFLDNTPDFAVPEGHTFVLGDNRDNANDSRGVHGGMGYVPAANVLGRMDRVLASCKPDGRFLADRHGAVRGAVTGGAAG